MKLFVSFAMAFLAIAASSLVAFCVFFAPSSKVAETVFVVPQQSADFDVPSELYTKQLIKHEAGFRWLYGFLVAGKTTAPGGYRISGSMHAWAIVRKLSSPPDFVWVNVRDGLRKEQIGLLLQDKLGWTDTQLASWNSAYADNVQYREGVYFPDMYLLPRDETPRQIADRFIANFNEKVAPYMDEFLRKEILWTTAIIIASLIERETGSAADMPIISAVIWNRLNQGMRLQIDATIQYAMGDNVGGWWPVVKGSDTRTVNSLYNTYLHDGLPPGPIANPGINAIAAVANPADTTCLFYLHSNKVMYCADTYEKHLENIELYLN